jgi:hypothetical protein
VYVFALAVVWCAPRRLNVVYVSGLFARDPFACLRALPVVQDCFKAAWKLHKAVHKPAVDPASIPSHMQAFEYTGTLRPAHLSPTRTLPDSIERPDYAVTGAPHEYSPYMLAHTHRTPCSHNHLSHRHVRVATGCTLHPILCSFG